MCSYFSEEVFRIKNTNNGRQKALENADEQNFIDKPIEPIEISTFIGNSRNDNRNSPVECKNKKSLQQNSPLPVCFRKIFLKCTHLS